MGSGEVGASEPGKGYPMRAIHRFFARRVGHIPVVAAALFGIAPRTATADEVTSAAVAADGATQAQAAQEQAAQEQTAQEIAQSRQNISDEISSEIAHVLPGALNAELDPHHRAVGTTWAGYDGATGNPVVNATAEGWLVPRLSLLVGAGSTTQPGQVRLRAEGGVRYMLLDQRQHGLNLSLGFLYRQDRFSDEEGMLEWSALVSRRFGATLALVSFIYAQDGEGDDREGEIRAAGLHEIGARLRIGLDGRARGSLGSSDPHRLQHANPVLEFNAGPMAAYTFHGWSLITEAGISGQKVDQMQIGLLILGGISAVF